MRPSLAVHVLALAAAPLAAPLAAQPVQRTLAAPEARLDEPFTSITGLRELRDGRVIVADASERTLQLFDLRSGAARAIGREGSGPGEWRVPSRLHALPGDSTLMEDFANRRYLVIGPNGVPGETFRIADGSPAAFGSFVGVDAQGRLIFERAVPPADAGPRAAATGVSLVLRYDRRTARTDTIARLATVVGEQSGAMALPGGLVRTFTNLPLAPRDALAVTADGQVAIVRHDPYRLELLTADGRPRQGPPASAARIRVTQAEREAFARSQVRPGSIVVSGPASAAAPRPSAADIDAAAMQSLTNPDMTWPEFKPPFVRLGVLGAPDGRVWVLRSSAHDDPVPVFDVFDAAGRVVERIAIPARTRLVGFGAGSVYLARSDADDLQYLERYRLPR